MAQMARIRPTVRHASGNRSGWCKHVLSVDTSKQSGYAFSGPLLTEGREVELPVDAIVLNVDPHGSAKNGWEEASVHRLEADGSLTELTDPDDRIVWKTDLLKVRDLVFHALAGRPSTPSTAAKPAAAGNLSGPWSNVNDDELLAEARRRGLIDSPARMQIFIDDVKTMRTGAQYVTEITYHDEKGQTANAWVAWSRAMPQALVDTGWPIYYSSPGSQTVETLGHVSPNEMDDNIVSVEDHVIKMICVKLGGVDPSLVDLVLEHCMLQRQGRARGPKFQQVCLALDARMERDSSNLARHGHRRYYDDIDARLRAR